MGLLKSGGIRKQKRLHATRHPDVEADSGVSMIYAQHKFLLVDLG